MNQTSRWMLILCNQREAFSFLLFLATSHVLFHSSFGATKSTPTFKPIKLDCSDDSFIQDDTTRTSLEALFSSLRSKALRSNSGSGAIGSGPGAIYGSFLCQSDLSYEDCRTCIHMAAANLLQSCSSSSSSASSRRGAIWINCCQLHYSDRNIHGVAGINGFNLASLHEETNSMKPIEQVSKPTKAVNYLRRLMDAPQPTAASDGGDGKKSSSGAMPIMISILAVVLAGTSLYCIYCWRWRKRNAIRRAQIENLRPLPSSDLPLMDLSTIQAATNNFSEENKLGEGGFGPVYRGVLCGGNEVAIKRLSAKSRQGAVEFRNEVELIAKLQHRNLVRLLGFCAGKDEKLLIYEYLPNRSLDSYLFDPSKRCQLDWKKRHQIIAGIARGLLYLHEDSLLKVIHRDLKASNVLLDNKMNPKISDFGMAKIFEGEENEVTTGKVVGTLGYMAPEYAIQGIFSVKSDVFSFGVLLLEILSGERNGGSYLHQHGHTLVKHAWQLWTRDRSTEFMDPLLGDSYPKNEACRCIHVGLLCVQENPEDRPTMSSAVLMLRSDQTPLSPPSEPPSYARSKTPELQMSPIMFSTSTGTQTVNEVTITLVEPR
ncbi:putative receptor-like protein kinase At4g00960 isoform X2 [Phoenix dactylifera]|uniref:non-specific serine/threonine protein kinase n=1 Tax=Phoenix dactylifera TaxID=42345 RepID=A0A8B9AV18_PHODC|nr:putative receptor-like protein kinase At4g00960 isoform X2 [Phoenix dactylifera]